MRYGTHTEACSLNGYESVLYLTILLVLVLPWISGFMSIIVLTAHALLYPWYPPASCLLSYHALSAVGLYLKPYKSDLLVLGFIWFIALHMLILARHLAFASPLAWGVSSDSPGSSCPGHGAWS